MVIYSYRTWPRLQVLVPLVFFNADHTAPTPTFPSSPHDLHSALSSSPTRLGRSKVLSGVRVSALLRGLELVVLYRWVLSTGGVTRARKCTRILGRYLCYRWRAITREGSTVLQGTVSLAWPSTQYSTQHTVPRSTFDPANPFNQPGQLYALHRTHGEYLTFVLITSFEQPVGPDDYLPTYLRYLGTYLVISPPMLWCTTL